MQSLIVVFTKYPLRKGHAFHGAALVRNGIVKRAVGFQLWPCLASGCSTAAGAVLPWWKLPFADSQSGMCADFLLGSELGLFRRARLKVEVLTLFWRLFQSKGCFSNGLFCADILFVKISKNCTLFLG